MHELWEDTTQSLTKPKDVGTGQKGLGKGLPGQWLGAVHADLSSLSVARGMGAANVSRAGRGGMGTAIPSEPAPPSPGGHPSPGSDWELTELGRLGSSCTSLPGSDRTGGYSSDSVDHMSGLGVHQAK